MTDIDYTPEQLAEAERIVAAERVRQEAIATAKREAYAVPVRELVNGAAWAEVLGTLNQIRSTFEPDDKIAIHVDALADIMPRAAEAVPSLAPPPAA